MFQTLGLAIIHWPEIQRVENRMQIDERWLPVVMAVRTANSSPGMRIHWAARPVWVRTSSV